MPSEDYYDTEEFPEGYTAYDGSEVWRFIHERICFKEFSYDSDSWKADFNKAVSGLHSMISAQVILGIQEKINDGEEFTDEEMQWSNPAEEFRRRLSPQGETPLAIENLYFCFMLLLSAVNKARNRLIGRLPVWKHRGSCVRVYFGHFVFSSFERPVCWCCVEEATRPRNQGF